MILGVVWSGGLCAGILVSSVLIPAAEVGEDLGHEVVHVLAAVVASDIVVEIFPRPLDAVAIGAYLNRGTSKPCFYICIYGLVVPDATRTSFLDDIQKFLYGTGLSLLYQLETIAYMTDPQFQNEVSRDTTCITYMQRQSIPVFSVTIKLNNPGLVLFADIKSETLKIKEAILSSLNRGAELNISGNEQNEEYTYHFMNLHLFTKELSFDEQVLKFKGDVILRVLRTCPPSPPGRSPTTCAAPQPPAHRAHPPHPRVPCHRHRPAHRHDPDPHPRPRAPGRPRRTHPDRAAHQAARRRCRLPASHRRHHPRRRTRLLTTGPAPPAKFDSIKPTLSALAL